MYSYEVQANYDGFWTTIVSTDGFNDAIQSARRIHEEDGVPVQVLDHDFGWSQPVFELYGGTPEKRVDWVASGF